MKVNKVIYKKCIIFATFFFFAEIGLLLLGFHCDKSYNTVIEFMKTLFWALFGSLAIGAVIANITYQYDLRSKQRSLYINLLTAYLYYLEFFSKRLLKDITSQIVDEAMIKFRRKLDRFFDEMDESVLFDEVFEDDLRMNILNDLYRRLYSLHKTIDMLELNLKVDNKQEVKKTFIKYQSETKEMNELFIISANKMFGHKYSEKIENKINSI